MSLRMDGRYLGDLKVELTHEPSGTTVRTAAPVDNHGDGSSFSPTDLCAASLAACMVTIMAIVARRDGIDLGGLSFRLEKHMNADPRRIGQIPVVVDMPAGLDAEARRKLERAALTCPVMRTLDDAVEKPVEFVYPD